MGITCVFCATHELVGDKIVQRNILAVAEIAEEFARVSSLQSNSASTDQ
jgi:hypothetical protein